MFPLSVIRASHIPDARGQASVDDQRLSKRIKILPNLVIRHLPLLLAEDDLSEYAAYAYHIEQGKEPRCTF